MRRLIGRAIMWFIRPEIESDVGVVRRVQVRNMVRDQIKSDLERGWFDRVLHRAFGLQRQGRR